MCRYMLLGQWNAITEETAVAAALPLKVLDWHMMCLIGMPGNIRWADEMLCN